MNKHKTMINSGKRTRVVDGGLRHGRAILRGKVRVNIGVAAFSIK